MEDKRAKETLLAIHSSTETHIFLVGLLRTQGKRKGDLLDALLIISWLLYFFDFNLCSLSIHSSTWTMYF